MKLEVKNLIFLIKTLKDIQRQIINFAKSLQDHGCMFYLFTLANSQSQIHPNNSGVCFGPFHHLFVLYSTYKILLTFEVV